MMGIGRILHTHKSFSYCWCKRIIHKVRTVLQTYVSIILFTLISSLPIANTKRVTFSEEGCMSIELVRVLVWVSFSSSLYPISIYRFFSSLFSPSSKLRKYYQRSDFYGRYCVVSSSPETTVRSSLLSSRSYAGKEE